MTSLRDRIVERFDLAPGTVGVVIVDHGSRREASNELLLEVVTLFQEVAGMPVVEPAHMELAEPSIATAFERCVQRGAQTVVVFPYFLSPGRHWSQDIPRLAAEAAKAHAGVRHLVTSPLGLHRLMAEVMGARIEQCLGRSLEQGEPCELCAPTHGCQMRSASDSAIN